VNANFIISVQGRGASYGFMLTCDEDEVTSRCVPALRSGFECFVYKIEPSPLGNPGFRPDGAITLRRIFHLYNAHEEFKQEAVDIITRLDCHSVESSKEYLDIMINTFQAEKEKLHGQIENQQVPSSGRPYSEPRLVPQTSRLVPQTSSPEPNPRQDSETVKTNQPNLTTGS
jgi:hypothetical protein